LFRIVVDTFKFNGNVSNSNSSSIFEVIKLIDAPVFD